VTSVSDSEYIAELEERVERQRKTIDYLLENLVDLGFEITELADALDEG